MNKKDIKKYIDDGVIDREMGTILYFRVVRGQPLQEISKALNMDTAKIKRMEKKAAKLIESNDS